MGGINPGRLRDRVEFQSLNRTETDRGGDNGAFATAFKTMAEIAPMKPVTTVEDGQMTIIQPYRVLIRYSQEHAVKPDMKLLWKGAKFLISNIMQPDTRNRTQTFTITQTDEE